MNRQNAEARHIFLFFFFETNNSLHFAYSLGHCLLILLYWRGNGIQKIKDDSKLKGKQTSNAAVRDQFQLFATFLTPILSRYRLPLRPKIFQVPIWWRNWQAMRIGNQN